MKLWQKAFWGIMVVFLIGFDVTIFLLLDKSYSLNQTNLNTAANNERYIIERSLYDRISGIANLYTELNADNLKLYILPYASYYVNQNIYLELYLGDVLVYSNFPHPLYQRPELDIHPGEKSSVSRSIAGISYLFITSYLDEPHSDLKFVYIKDIQDLVDYRNEMINHAVIISILVSVILSILIIGMLLQLTGPIRKLNRAAQEIADGQYQKRVEVNSKDEIGELARNFNAMANSVETHVQKLTNLNEERQRFINNLAHEMRTPLTAIRGYSEFLKYANFSQQESTKALDYMIHQSERMKNMAGKLMDLVSLNGGNVHFAPLDLREIMDSVEYSLMQPISEKSIHVNKDLQKTEISGDKDLLESLVLNVMENAVRAAPVGGQIQVKTYEDRKGVILSISDNGVGMKAEELQKIFEPFYRADQSRSRTQGGAGLGLALSKRICELHRAQINITSNLNAGTEVEIQFTNNLQVGEDSNILVA